MQLLIDKAYPVRDFRLFGWLCAVMVALRVLPNVLSSISGYLSTYIRNLLEYKLCFRVIYAIQRLPLSYMEEHRSGMFLERAIHDVRSITQSITQVIPQIVAIGFTFLVAIALMFRLTPSITLLVLAVIPFNYVITVLLSRKLRSLYQTNRAIDEKITTFTAETVEGTITSRLFSLNRSRRKKLKELLRDSLRTKFATWRATVFWGQLNNVFTVGWGLVLFCGGWYLVFSNRLQLGEVVALGMYITVLTRPFRQLASIYQSLMTSSVSAERVLDMLNEHHRTQDVETGIVLKQPPRRFELRKVSFEYKEGFPCLCNLDVHLQSGETIAIVGPSGAGKSTLIRLLSGLDDRYSGEFLVNGYDFRKLNRNSYLRHVSLVPQNIFFFNDSIRDNLGTGNALISQDIVEEYAMVLGVDEIVNSTPKGYDTKLGVDGVRFSSGQYQKLAALRASLKNASLLLLDEATSSVDIESERKLLKGIAKLRPRECVTVLVTHHIHLTTGPWFDRIIVIANGRIVEMGSSEQLCEEQGCYYKWLDSDQIF